MRRTTLTLEDDVAERIDAEAARTGKPVKTVVNQALRAGLGERRRASRRPFRVKARSMGLRRGMDLADVEGLLEQIDGVEHR